MRSKLNQLGKQQRHRFRGTFVRSGYKRFLGGYTDYACYSPTFLLKDIYLDDQLMTDHLWMNYGKQFIRLGRLRPQDRITFDARVDDYFKGHFPDFEHDYKLSYPTKVHLLNDDSERPSLPLHDHHALIGYIMLQNQDFYLKNGRPYDQFFVDCYHQWQYEQSQKSLKHSGLPF